MVNRDEFVGYLRDALNHMHDPAHLRRSPLAALFGVANRPDGPSVLRQRLIQAICALQPDAGVPSQAHTWRQYESLYYRYVQQFSQKEVADQLGLGERQLRREQRAALEALACQLWTGLQPIPEAVEAREGDTAGLPVPEEFSWLTQAPPDTPTDVKKTLHDAINLVRPLAGKYGVNVNLEVADVPSLAVDPVAFRQILLNVLGVTIARSPGGLVRISARPVPPFVEVVVDCTPSASPSQVPPEHAASLALAGQMADLCGGRLAASEADSLLRATLTLPATGQVHVLVIDDNVSALQLFERYTAGTHYRLSTLQDGEQAVSTAERLAPALIVLDVMMPRVDGWEILGRLRQHPRTQRIPIIVCTILDQEELALSLGADAYLRKPVTRHAFLAALEQQVTPAATGRC